MKDHELERYDIAVEKLVPSAFNPNEMTDQEFNLLCDNIERVGLTDPILVRAREDGMFDVVGGHHRLEAAKLFDYTEVPCTVFPVSMSDDEVKFQMTRHNIIKGKMSPAKFLKLYEGLSGEYADDAAAEMFGFANEDEFKKLINKLKHELPPDLQEQFEASTKEIKTVDDLANVLNDLMSKYGDQLDFHYMVLDYDGKDGLWIRMKKQDYSDALDVVEQCKQQTKVVDSLVRRMFSEFLALPDDERNVILSELDDAETKEDVSLGIESGDLLPEADLL